MPDWFCGWLVDCTSSYGNSTYGGVAPEIGDTWALTLGLSLVIGVLCLVLERKRRA